MHAVYKFDNLMTKNNGYFFQYVNDRKLSDIYHSHDFFEIIIIASGKCRKEINGEIADFEKNDIIILSPGDRHVFLDQSQDVFIICLSVRAKDFTDMCMMYGKELSEELCSRNSPKIFNNEDFLIRFLTLFPSFKQSFDKYNCVMLLSYILNLYASSVSTCNCSIPSELKTAMEKMKNPENIKSGLSAFIRLSSYSHSHLSRLMKKHFNMSLHEYIADLRLSEAYRLLTTTNTSSEEISENVGYASFSHFNKVFKGKYGITPSAARKKNRMWTV